MKFANLFSFVAPISQKFGENPQVYSRFKMSGHNGVDFAIPENTQVFAVFDGVISQVGYDPKGYGNYIRIKNTEGAEVLCGHLNEVRVKEGQSVKTSVCIGLSGNTGFSTGPHLHFGLRFWEKGCVKDYNNGFFGSVDSLPYFEMYNDVSSTPVKTPPVLEQLNPKTVANSLHSEELASDWAKESVAFVKEEGISNGERPKDNISREEFWLMLQRFVDALDIEIEIDDFEEVDFAKLPLDQRPSEWAEFAYLWVRELQISNGARPREFVSREEIWTMLFRFFQEETPHIIGAELKNVQTASEWAYEAQKWAVANDITNGERPFEFITREEVWVLLDRLFEKLS